MTRRLISLAAFLLITSAAAAPGQRQLDAHQRVIIKEYVLREAKASILSPRDGEPKAFAHALELALRAAGAWVAVDGSNTIGPAQVDLTRDLRSQRSGGFIDLSGASARRPQSQGRRRAGRAGLDNYRRPAILNSRCAQVGRALRTRPPIVSKPSSVNGQ